MTDNIAWLVSCPTSDLNFKNHLANASAYEIFKAIEQVNGMPHNKTKLNTLYIALKKREKAAQAAQKGGKRNAREI